MVSGCNCLTKYLVKSELCFVGFSQIKHQRL